ncbi:hypothetical protein GCM10011375_09920 [Hymenobacter qilianensis]|uniref:Uncharacterized protein n=2 Tax=Hymenobacter qilianensis TaxID=1385715 RepID=A0ACB5PNM6_9BACT|nr:hypothetical protein [Hymenobacter qilianensis]QNP53405.1 hypothetical protein H9L05_07395 [Hymenobacter qilianensis]GGF56805.1 hypothetical protein GCM10011375_09920 [Hymenobacter qilianensis]
MFVPFEELPPSARVWIYQADRPLTDTELAAVEPALAQFAAEWTSHGRMLRASAAFRHGQFLVLGLDEAVAGASGCSIDASVRFVRSLEEQLGLNLLEKSHLAFLVDGQVQLLDRRELRQSVATGQLQPDTPYFDNTIAQHGKLAAAWPAPAAHTWLAKYFQTSPQR